MAGRLDRAGMAALLTCASTTARAADPDPWFGRDKALHFGVSTGVAGASYGLSAIWVEDRTWRVILGGGAAVGLGVAKELYDAAGGGRASWKDLTWDVAGAATGVLIAWAIDRLISGDRNEGSTPEQEVLGEQTMTQRSTIIETKDAPAAIGPYSQARRVSSGDLVFCSGQIGLDPATGQMVSGGIEPETRRVIANLLAVLAASGAGPEHVVRTTIYLADLADFATVNGIYAETFGAAPPARATVQAAALPKGAKVEIDAIAVVPER